LFLQQIFSFFSEKTEKREPRNQIKMGIMDIIMENKFGCSKKYISECPKDVVIKIDDKEAEVEVVVNGKTSFVRDNDLRYWVEHPDNHLITPKLCDVFYKLLGFIPYTKGYNIWDKDADPSQLPNFLSLDKPTVMVEFMGMRIPKAVVKQMQFIRETQEESGSVFSNLKDFEPKIEEFPPEIRDDIEPALTTLIHYRTQATTKYLYIYEMLGIPFTNQAYFISGEDLVELNNSNLIKHGKFYDYYTYSTDRFNTYGTNDLSECAVSYITDTMIESFKLYDYVKVCVPPTPFQLRIYRYMLKHYQH
jgi:hypothetical protein